MKVRYFSEFYAYFFKVPINTRGLRKFSVRANGPDEFNLLTVNLFICVEELIVPVLTNQNLNKSCIFLNENHTRLS